VTGSWCSVLSIRQLLLFTESSLISIMCLYKVEQNIIIILLLAYVLASAQYSCSLGSFYGA